jgi:ferredoxin-NADP reductase
MPCLLRAIGLSRHVLREHLLHPCGPVPFMREINSALTERGVSPQDIQYEVFGPDLWHADFQ